jgi:predicted acetyltransferase
MIILLLIELEKRTAVTDNSLLEKSFKDSDSLVYQDVSLTLNSVFQLAGTAQPGYEFYINNNQKQVGTITILINDNFDTSFTQGNMGITIYPEYRGQGLPVKAAFAALPVFKHHHQKQYLMTFHKNNSLRKIIEQYTQQLGGRYLDEVSTAEGTVIRYLIDVE